MPKLTIRSGFEGIPCGAHRTDPARVLAVLFDLAPDAADVLGHRGGILPVAGGVPDLHEQLVVREDLPGCPSEEGEQVELARGELHELAADAHLTRKHLDLEL